MAKKYTLIWDEKKKKPKLEKDHDGEKVKIKDDGTVVIKGAGGDVEIPTDIWNHGSGPSILTIEF